MGGHLLQRLNRDTQRFAFKSAAQCRDGKWYDVYKQPIDKSKASKRGRLALIKENGKYKTIRESEINGRENILKTVFLNGEVMDVVTLAETKANSEKQVSNIG